MAYSFKGSISFGLVYIPVTLSPAVRNHDVSFNLLDRQTMSRVKYKKTCVDCGDREVRQEDLVKGYEYEDDKYVVFEEKDFETLKTKKDKTISIEQFTELSEIDPIYYDRAYYVVPTGGERAYALLLAAMEKQNKVGIAKTVLGTKETLIAIRAEQGRMLLSTMHFPEEIQANPAKEIDPNVNEKELTLAESIIENMTAAFEPGSFKDEYRERVMQAIETKVAGREIETPRENKSAKVSDLLEALTKSLRESESKTGSRADTASGAALSSAARAKSPRKKSEKALG